MDHIFKVHKYNENNSYSKHKLNSTFNQKNNQKSLISMVVYLNEAQEGGTYRFTDSQFKNGQIDVIPQMGKVLLYKLEKCIGEVTQVQKGTQYMLKCDFIYKWYANDECQEFQSRFCKFCNSDVKYEILQSCQHVYFTCGCTKLDMILGVPNKCQACQKNLQFLNQDINRKCDIF